MKKVCLLLLGMVCLKLSAQTLKNSGPIVHSKKTNLVIRDLIISNPNGNGIELWECTNVTIENCVIQNTSGNGIYGFKSNGIKVRNCTFTENATGVYVSTGQGIVVENCKFKNVNGPRPRGQFVQYNYVTGAGNRISCNYMESIMGQGDPEDAINTHASHGTSASPIIIENNYVKGGGPSASGGGILLGDGGGSYMIARGNVLVNPGQYGMAIVSASNMEISNNKIYGSQQYFTNVGLTIWQAYADIPCGANNKVINNHVWWKNKDGVNTPFWTDNKCNNPTITGNVWMSTQVSATMAPPACAGLTTSTTPSPTTTTTPTTSSLLNAGADKVITLPTNSVTLSGTVSNVSNIVAASWTKKSGGTATIASPNQGAVSPVNTQVTGLQAGVYIFTLVVKDKSNVFHQDDVQVTVNSSGTTTTTTGAPVPNAGADKTITLPINYTSLSGVVSNVGNVAATSWSKKSGGAATISNPNQGGVSPVNTQISGLQSGTYVFTLVVKDKNSKYYFDDITVTVKAAVTEAPVQSSGSTDTLTVDSTNGNLGEWNSANGPGKPTAITPEHAKAGPLVNMYPNPASSIITLTIEAEEVGKSSVTIYDLNGKPVLNEAFVKAGPVVNKSVNVSRLAKGPYSLIVSVGANKRVVKKLIKL
jgi:parallel beta-helix repeat protein